MQSSGGKLPLYLPLGKVHFEVLHRDLMRVYNHTERAGLKMPDIVASAFSRPPTFMTRELVILPMRNHCCREWLARQLLKRLVVMALN